MNIFEQYGIKEVADVTLYSIELDENDDEIYIPVLYLDTLKVSTVEETAEQTSARGGLGNSELIIWDYGKEITVTLEDALYSPATMGMTWGGKHGTKKFELCGDLLLDRLSTDHEDYGKIISAKVIIDSFSDYAFDYLHNYSNSEMSVDEKLNDETAIQQWGVIAKLISDNGLYRGQKGSQTNHVGLTHVETKNGEHTWRWNGATAPFKGLIFDNIGTFTISSERNKNIAPPQEAIFQIDHALNNVKYLDRMEKCKATQQFCINTDTNTAHGNYRYLQSYSQTELTVFIDPRTMQPYEPNTDEYVCKNGDKIYGNLRVFKQHEVYYKWTRSKAPDYTTLGHQILVDAIHFPGTYRLVGETYSRSRSTGKDERFQFEIPLCKMGTENNFTLEAEGDPTTFNMTLKVLRREDGVMMKLTQYEVEDAKYGDYTSGSTVVVPEDEVVPESPVSNDGIT